MAYSFALTHFLMTNQHALHLEMLQLNCIEQPTDPVMTAFAV